MEALKDMNNNNWQFLLTLIVGLIGAAAWTPTICNALRQRKVHGRMVSRYLNLDRSFTKSLFVFKLAILIKNKPINLKKVSCKILDEKGNLFEATAENSRLTTFHFEDIEVEGKILIEGGKRKLIVHSEDFLNNRAILLAGENTIGYLLFKFPVNLDGNIRSTTFIFEDFKGGSEKVEIEESKLNPKELFFDDSIWEPEDA